MNQPSKTAVQGRADQIKSIQQVQVSLAQDQVLSLSVAQRHVAENNFQYLRSQYQYFLDICRSTIGACHAPYVYVRPNADSAMCDLMKKLRSAP